MGAALGSVVGLVAGAALGFGRPEQPQPLVVGGIDLSGVDLGRPFWVDFSVPRNASPNEKGFALNRLRDAMFALWQRFPAWSCTPEVDASAGRFVLVVTPSPHLAANVVRSLVRT